MSRTAQFALSIPVGWLVAGAASLYLHGLVPYGVAGVVIAGWAFLYRRAE